MTLIEAIKSGKKYRRPCYFDWYEPAQFNSDRINFCILDVLADDWEVEEATVTITFSDFNRAWHAMKIQAPKDYEEVYKLLVKELGL